MKRKNPNWLTDSLINAPAPMDLTDLIYSDTSGVQVLPSYWHYLLNTTFKFFKKETQQENINSLLQDLGVKSSGVHNGKNLPMTTIKHNLNPAKCTF